MPVPYDNRHVSSDYEKHSCVQSGRQLAISIIELLVSVFILISSPLSSCILRMQPMRCCHHCKKDMLIHFSAF